MRQVVSWMVTDPRLYVTCAQILQLPARVSEHGDSAGRGRAQGGSGQGRVGASHSHAAEQALSTPASIMSMQS